MNRDKVREVADIIELTGNVGMSDVLREGKDVSIVKVRPLLLRPEDVVTLAELVKRNPESSFEQCKEVLELRRRMVVLEVGGQEVLIHESVGAQIQELLVSVL